MPIEKTKSTDTAAAGLVAKTGASERGGAGGVFTVTCFDKDGNLKWEEKSHNLVVNDRVIARNINVEILSSKVTAVTSTTFTISCDNSGATSGAEGAYSVGFNYDHTTSSLVTGGNMTAPADSSDLILNSLKMWFPLNSRSGGSYAVNFQKGINGIGIEAGATEPDFYANMNFPTLFVRQGTATMTIVAASLVGSAYVANSTTHTLTINALGTSSATSTVVSMQF